MSERPSLFEALADVKELRRRILDRQLFFGYSGWTRIAGGFVAIIGAFLLSRDWVPAMPWAHIIGWGAICAISAIANFSAVFHWWKSQAIELIQLRPVLDLLAPFIVGALLTFCILYRQDFELLFPIWMWVFGLMNISSRHSMPQAMVFVGWFYIFAGAICAFRMDNNSFLHPWPMGITFFIGEIAGGSVFIKLRKENKTDEE